MSNPVGHAVLVQKSRQYKFLLISLQQSDAVDNAREVNQAVREGWSVDSIHFSTAGTSSIIYSRVLVVMFKEVS